MTQFSISLSAVLVGMDFVLQLVLMGISFNHYWLHVRFYRNPLLTLYFACAFKCSNIFRVFCCTPGSVEATTLEASRNPMRYIELLTCCAFYFYTFLFLICCCHGLVCCDLHPTYPFSGCCGHGPLWHSSFDVGQSYFIWEISRFICTKIRSILNAWDASWVWNPLPSYLRTGRQEGWWVMTRKEHPRSMAFFLFSCCFIKFFQQYCLHDCSSIFLGHRYLLFCAFIILKLVRCYKVRRKFIEGHIIAAIFFTF